MSKQISVTIAVLAFLLGAAAVAASPTISAGVKQGDWIEYQVTVTGTTDPAHNVTWARMEIVGVQGNIINLSIATKFADGTTLNENITLNLDVGQLGDDFIIPANLNSGDIFFDKNQGNITISDVEEKTYAGATRKVAIGTTNQTTYFWDQATGVLVDGISTFPDFTLHSLVDKTNLWQAQTLGLEPTLFYAAVIGVAVIIVVVIAFFVLRRKKPAKV